MFPWFSTPNVRPSLGELLPNSHAADAAAVQEGLALHPEIIPMLEDGLIR